MIGRLLLAFVDDDIVPVIKQANEHFACGIIASTATTLQREAIFPHLGVLSCIESRDFHQRAVGREAVLPGLPKTVGPKVSTGHPRSVYCEECEASQITIETDPVNGSV